MNAELTEAIIAEWTWKTPAMREMTLAVCRLALARGAAGEFSALDLPQHGAAAHGGSGIAGSVFRTLADHGLIAPLGVFVGNDFQQRYVRNAAGNRIGVWRLCAPGLARALLHRYDPGAAPEPRQEELVLA